MTVHLLIPTSLPPSLPPSLRDGSTREDLWYGRGVCENREDIHLTMLYYSVPLETQDVYCFAGSAEGDQNSQPAAAVPVPVKPFPEFM